MHDLLAFAMLAVAITVAYFAGLAHGARDGNALANGPKSGLWVDTEARGFRPTQEGPPPVLPDGSTPVSGVVDFCGCGCGNVDRLGRPF